jgi:hypothetical protein
VAEVAAKQAVWISGYSGKGSTKIANRKKLGYWRIAAKGSGTHERQIALNLTLPAESECSEKLRSTVNVGLTVWAVVKW